MQTQSAYFCYFCDSQRMWIAMLYHLWWAAPNLFVNATTLL